MTLRRMVFFFFKLSFVPKTIQVEGRRLSPELMVLNRSCATGRFVRLGITFNLLLVDVHGFDVFSQSSVS